MVHYCNINSNCIIYLPTISCQLSEAKAALAEQAQMLQELNEWEESNRSRELVQGSTAALNGYRASVCDLQHPRTWRSGIITAHNIQTKVSSVGQSVKSFTVQIESAYGWAVYGDCTITEECQFHCFIGTDIDGRPHPISANHQSSHGPRLDSHTLRQCKPQVTTHCFPMFEYYLAFHCRAVEAWFLPRPTRMGRGRPHLLSR